MHGDEDVGGGGGGDFEEPESRWRLVFLFWLLYPVSVHSYLLIY